MSTRTGKTPGRRALGLKILLGSVAFCLLGMAPLLLYIAFGPADGNPIGLGLLAMLAMFVGVAGVAVGGIVMLTAMSGRSGR